MQKYLHTVIFYTLEFDNLLWSIGKRIKIDLEASRSLAACSICPFPQQ